MTTLKICTILTGSINSVEEFKREFDRYPNGMPLDVFRDVLQRYAPTRKHDDGNNTFLCHVRNHKTLCEESAMARVGLQMNSGDTYEQVPKSMLCSPTGISKAFVPLSALINEAHPSSNDLCLGRQSISGNSSSIPFSNVSRSWKPADWSDVNAVEALFHKIDGDSDGYVTWDDVLQVAVEEATQSITVMAEEMRSYSFSRTSPRMKLIQSAHGLEYHNFLCAVVTRTNPLLLLSKKNMSVVRSFSAEDLNYTHPTIVEYLPFPDVLLAYSHHDKTIRGWWSVVSGNRMGTLNPLKQKHAARRIRVRPSVFPHSFFIAGSQGVVSQFQVPKQRSMLDISLVRLYENLHSRESGGITDFALTDEWLLSTGFDHRLLSTNLETGRSILIGRPRETIRLVEYNRSFACLPSVSYSNHLLLWDVRSSTVTPNNAFRDDSVKPHLSDVIGLCNAKGLPHVVTADISGLVKIWDLRMLRCVQTIYADGSLCDELSADVPSGIQQAHHNKVSLSQSPARQGETRSIRSLCYFGGSQEIVCCSAEEISCVRYNHRVGGAAADLDIVCCVCHDLRQGTFILQGATRISVWDTTEGYRKRVHDRSSDSSITYWQQEILSMCIDHTSSRVFLAIADGLVEVRSSKTLTLIESFRVHDSAIHEMVYSQKHKILISIAVNGALSIRQETETGASETTVPLSSHPLRNLTHSDEVGLVACCDDHHLYLLDIKQSRLMPLVVTTDEPVRTMLMLGSYSVLVTGNEKGELIFRSTLPVEENHVPLATLTLGKSIPGSPIENTSPKIHREKGDHSMFGTFSSQVVSSFEKTNLSVEGGGTASGQRLSVARTSLKDGGFEEMVQSIFVDESSDDGICALACDDVTHRLFVADRSGNLYIISLCSFIESYGLQKCVFERRTRYRLNGVSAEEESSFFTVLRTISSNKYPVHFLAWIPALSVLVSCDSNRLVKIFDNDGNETGQLLMDRLPPKKMMDVIDDSSVDKACADANKVTPMVEYVLPSIIPISAQCPDCGNQKTKVTVKTSILLDDELKVQSDCTSPIDSPRVQTVPYPSGKAFPNLRKTRIGSVANLSAETPILERAHTPAVASPHQRMSFVPCPPVSSARGVGSRDRKMQWSAPCVVQQTLPTTRTPHLVELEERRLLRPQKEKQCAFWEKKDIPLRVMSTNADFLHPSVRTAPSIMCRNRDESCDAFTSTSGSAYAWWKPLNDLPTTKSASSRNYQRLDFEAVTAERGTTSIPDAAQTHNELSLVLGTQKLPPSPRASGGASKHHAIKGRASKLVRKESDSRFLKTAPPFHDVVRTYDNELHRCIRGRGRNGRLQKNGGTISSFLLGLQPIVRSDSTTGE